MIDNAQLLRDLFDDRCLALEPAPFLETTPAPLTPARLADRVEGMLLGLAIGDALGNTSESMLPSERREYFGEIRDYRPHRAAERRRVGLPSDDTQLAFWTLEQLLADDGLVPDHLAQRFCRGRIFGIGNTVRTFIRRYKDQGLAWPAAGVASAGNGAIMRIAPVLLPHLKQSSPALWADAAIAAMITHNDRASTACCVAFIHLLWELLRRDTPPPRGWWVDTFCDVAEALEGETRHRPRKNEVRPAEVGPLARYTRRVVLDALAREHSVLDACNEWYSGAYLLETMPSVLHILEWHGHDPEEAIVRAVNDTWDNDTIAAVVGAAMGALHGVAALPARWRQGLLGRTREHDDGQVHRDIEQALAAFVR